MMKCATVYSVDDIAGPLQRAECFEVAARAIFNGPMGTIHRGVLPFVVLNVMAQLPGSTSWRCP
jgi:hypothetical protein